MTSGNIRTSRYIWFVRGCLIGVLATGTCTALSYFARTRGWGSLLGDETQAEAIGFPMQIWHSRDYQYVYSFENPGFLPNLACALAITFACGLVAVAWSAPFNRLIQKFEGEFEQQERFQFTLRGLLLFTVVAALASLVARSLATSPYVLGGIYVLGPLCLVAIAMLPRGLRWQQRIAIIGPGAIILIALALVIGTALKIEIDKVLLGIYVCWTPQSFFGAIVLTAGLLVQHRRTLVAAEPT